MTGLLGSAQPQLLLAACRTQPLHCCCSTGFASSVTGLLSAQLHTIAAAAAAAAGTSSSTSSDSTSTSGRSSIDSDAFEERRQEQYRKRLKTYKARLPRARKYGPSLRERDEDAFEQMRLVVGYYDLPQNLHKQQPQPPTHVTINNLQTLQYTDYVDPFYRLALLSYRSKLQNMEVVKSVSKARSFLGQLSALPDFVPAHLEELTTAAMRQQQQHKQQQQQQDGAAESADSSCSSSESSGGSDSSSGGSSTSTISEAT